MILAQKFLTHDGAAKRARFETRHNVKFSFVAVRYLDGERDTKALDEHAYKAKRYTWRLEKVKRLTPGETNAHRSHV